MAGREGPRVLRGVEAGQELRQPLHVAVDTYPEALEGTRPALLKRRSGKATFNFPSLDDEMARDLEALLTRLFERYWADHAGG